MESVALVAFDGTACIGTPLAVGPPLGIVDVKMEG